MQADKSIKIEVSKDIRGYKLLDSGNKLKLEEIGGLRIVRSEPRAWWKLSLSQSEWDKAVALFESESKKQWVFKKDIKKEFQMEFEGFKILIKFLKTSKQIGIFPEQAGQWRWIKSLIKESGREVNVLNLFGYTGLSSLAAVAAGAKVTHVDGSKTVIQWARENQKLSGLENKPIRWILDDAIDFVKREIKRGVKYDGIILDPPSFGRGPQGQVWKIEENLPELLELCKTILSPNPLFVILNLYSTELSSLSAGNLLGDLLRVGKIEIGELALEEENSKRLLPMSIFARSLN